MKKLLFLLLLVFLIPSCKPSNPKVSIETELGNIVVEVFKDKAPVTAYTFLHYVTNKRYNGSEFYRVVRPDNQPGKKYKIEVIQGGLEFIENVDTIQGIPHENTKLTGLRHLDGTISMARDKPGSASTEFFICIGNQPELDFGGRRNPDGQGFAAFGRVLSGMDIVRKIQALPADSLKVLRNKIKIKQMVVN